MIHIQFLFYNNPVTGAKLLGHGDAIWLPKKDHSILQTMRPNKSTTEISNSHLSGGAATRRVILTTSTKLNVFTIASFKLVY